MPVPVGRIWGNAKFSRLTPTAKLLYIYLVTTPTISTVGVVSLDPNMVAATLGVDMDTFREATKELIDASYIYVQKHSGVIYYIIPEHFSTLPKTHALTPKLIADLRPLPVRLRDFLKEIGIDPQLKEIKYQKPSLDEIRDYALSLGHNVNPSEFYDFYEDSSTSMGITDYWVDSRGMAVKNWRMKLKNVWCKDSNKISIAKGAPKGFETFSVVDNVGMQHYPERWEGGRPKHRDFIINKQMNREFDKLKKEENEDN